MALDDELSKIWLNGNQLKKGEGFTIPIESELAGRSITPTSFLAVHLNYGDVTADEITTEFTKIEKLLASFEAKKAAFIKCGMDTISSLKSLSARVVHPDKCESFGKPFNQLSEEFDPIIGRITQYHKQLGLFKDFIGKVGGLPLTFVEDYECQGAGKTIQRIGINVAHLKGQIGLDLASIFSPTDKSATLSVSTKGTKTGEVVYLHILHPLEVILIRKAIKKFDDGRKTISVDIFERNEDGSIKTDDGSKNPSDKGMPAVHNLVLCKQGNQILLLDPSSSAFSMHILFNTEIINANLSSDEPDEEEEVSEAKAYPAPAEEEGHVDQTDNADFIEFVGSSNLLKIYSAPQNIETGPAPNQARDCINIAYLISQYLELSDEVVDFKTFPVLEGIQQITNQRLPKEFMKTNKDHLFFFELSDVPADQFVLARIRQSSNPEIRDLVHKCMVLMDKQIQCSKSFRGTLLDNVKSKALELFKKLPKPEEYDIITEEMKGLCGEVAQMFYEVQVGEVS